MHLKIVIFYLQSYSNNKELIPKFVSSNLYDVEMYIIISGILSCLDFSEHSIKVKDVLKLVG